MDQRNGIDTTGSEIHSYGQMFLHEGAKTVQGARQFFQKMVLQNAHI